MKNIFKFSIYSKRNLVPNILKDPKFTKTGIAEKKKFKPLIYQILKIHNYIMKKPLIKRQLMNQ